ncbi:hypothetical protein C4J81_09730 [Deltaproteobacteria bacterium Smac51]|nr:hypothetical protein C4J81_09730 [Deltaproteobacteria bacterium Smac51]
MNIASPDNSNGVAYTNSYAGLRPAASETPAISFSSYLDSDEQPDNSSDSSLASEVKDQDETAVNEENSSTEFYVEASGVVHNSSGTQIQSLPEGFGLIGDEAIKYLENRGAKIIFDFGEDGSVSIKKGLSTEDYLRAKRTLEEWGRSPSEGLGLSPFEEWGIATKTSKRTQ